MYADMRSFLYIFLRISMETFLKINLKLIIRFQYFPFEIVVDIEDIKQIAVTVAN